jgi:hypothetical protein
MRWSRHNSTRSLFRAAFSRSTLASFRDVGATEMQIMVVNPNGVKYYSPEQRPGVKGVYQIEALKGRDN